MFIDYKDPRIKYVTFPGGEIHVDSSGVKNNNQSIHVSASVRCWDDWGKLIALLDSLRGVKRYLFLPYFPGARQDREQPGFAFTAKIYAEMLRGRVEHVTVADVHSDEAFQTLFAGARTTCANITVDDILSTINEPPFNGQPFRLVLAPDKGAVERAKLATRQLNTTQVAFCTKIRDSSTGFLKLGAEQPTIPEEGNILVVDDICDGGRTFLNIARHYGTKYGRRSFHLYVTHGIFSNGFKELFDVFTSITTTDSVFQRTDVKSERVNVIELKDAYLNTLRPE